jgi:hypothetical protein
MHDHIQLLLGSTQAIDSATLHALYTKVLRTGTNLCYILVV